MLPPPTNNGWALREASLLCQSERLKQAREWALEQYRASGGQALPEIEPVIAAPRPEAQTSRVKRKAKPERAPKLGDMAQEAGQGMRQGWDDARQWTSEAVAGAASKLHGASVYGLGAGHCAIALLFIGVARATARRSPSPMVLPTLVVDAAYAHSREPRRSGVGQGRHRLTKGDYDSAARSETILALSRATTALGAARRGAL